MTAWRDNTPVYLQIKEQVVAQILERTLEDGQPTPSVRQVASDLQVNPMTVSRAYAELADEGVLETRRGLGTFIAAGARDRLLTLERTRFLQDQWPRTLERIRLLALDPHALLKGDNGDAA